MGHVSTYSILGWFFIGTGAFMMANTLLKSNEKEGYVMRLVKKNIFLECLLSEKVGKTISLKKRICT